ncbi:hypothetical protein [Streptomyces misionensis]|uniref:hypothetical protein n=1 Tax=Streptomyces misionensis TaxID=67331 RepID=UPI0021BDE3D2|nr:hypothetical protein [Streptomyces misionensis]
MRDDTENDEGTVEAPEAYDEDAAEEPDEEPEYDEDAEPESDEDAESEWGGAEAGEADAYTAVAPPRTRADAEPDVFLDVPQLRVDEIDLDVEDLRAHVSLQAEVLDLLRLNVGADVSLGRVHLGISGVEAQAQLRVRLDNVALIIDRVLTTLDRNPQILEELAGGLGSAVRDVGGGARQAVGELGSGAGRAVEEVGHGAGYAVRDIGRGAGDAVEYVGRGAGSAVDEVGHGAGHAVREVGEGAGTAVGFPGTGERESSSRSRRTNLPDTVAADREYRDIRVDYRLATRLVRAPGR